MKQHERKRNEKKRNLSNPDEVSVWRATTVHVRYVCPASCSRPERDTGAVVGIVIAHQITTREPAQYSITHLLNVCTSLHWIRSQPLLLSFRLSLSLFSLPSFLLLSFLLCSDSLFLFKSLHSVYMCVCVRVCTAIATPFTVGRKRRRRCVAYGYGCPLGDTRPQPTATGLSLFAQPM